uniref:BPI fold-containing family B member 3-like n=1 Tax=Pogona vitticeps TaxID=103695 RepID=A0ABM5G4M0_9SAUR
MWKILGLVALCGLWGPSEGKVAGVRYVCSESELNEGVSSILLQEDVLPNHLKSMVFPNIRAGGLGGFIYTFFGLNIVNVEILSHDGTLLPEINGGDITYSVRLHINGNFFFSAFNLVRISVEKTFRIQYGFENFQAAGSLDLAIRECHCTFGAIQISIFNGLLSASVQATIRESLISSILAQICPILQTVFGIVRATFLGTLNVVLPLSGQGNLNYQLASLPSITNQQAGIDIFSDIEVPGKGIISIPETALPVTVPSLQNYKQCQCLHPKFLDIVLSVLVSRQPQELSCTPDAYLGANELRSAILALVPSQNSGIISVSVLFIRLTLDVDPVFAIRIDSVIISASVRIEFFLKNAAGPDYSILIVRSTLTLAARISLTDNKLTVAVSISGNLVVLVSSGVGISNVSSLESHCGNLLREIFLPAFNEPLAVGIPLPTPFGRVLTSASVLPAEDGLALCS